MTTSPTPLGGAGDEASRTFRLKPGRNAKSYSAFAITAAKRVLPREEPWTVQGVELVSAENLGAEERKRFGP